MKKHKHLDENCNCAKLICYDRAYERAVPSS